ncbi:hypothetical protein [Spiroplasma cantharicola]|uniref:Uncharacterized protein n=1 Tax=Spiroplasma cantharicola TaxID=362837 RepID=A0A0M5KH36_9MOLU|nr:hypothetical protein [Spiroplasma cantharicola]ALD66789.1 hypothetical protein SCANT_v1c08830 [Spiroplasma cantharicola]
MYQTKINFKSGAIQFYIKTPTGVENIKVGKEDLLIIPSYTIIGKRLRTYTLNDFDFMQLNIPANLVDGQQQLVISYSASYNVEGYDLKPHTNYGTIEIDRRNLTENIYQTNNSTVTIANLAYGYLNFDFNNKYKKNYFDLIKNDLKIKIEQNSLNTIDPKIRIQSDYSLWNDLELSILGKKMKLFIEMFLQGANRTNRLESTPKLKSVTNFSNYYNIKKIKDRVTYQENYYEITNDNFTSYSFPKSLVEETENGERGILWNPLYNNPIIYNRVIDLNSREISIDYICDNLNKGIYEINYDREINNKLNYLVNYKIDEINSIGWKEKESIINYINENQKII